MSEQSEDFKTILFYLVAVVGFVVMTAWLTEPGSYEEEGVDLPQAQVSLATPTATRWPKTPTPAIRSTGCVVTPGSMRDGYLPGAPFRTDLASAALQRRGERLVISGTVYAADCRTPLPEALIEVWQADLEGVYDRSADFSLRGQMRTDKQGRYQFSTVKPGRYLAGDEPLPARLHYRVSYGEQVSLFTQLFFAGDPFLNQFPFVVPPLVISLTQQTQVEGPVWVGEFNVVLPVAAQGPRLRRVDGY
jgi:catechol 1,2-dioxygenase